MLPKYKRTIIGLPNILGTKLLFNDERTREEKKSGEKRRDWGERQKLIRWVREGERGGGGQGPFFAQRKKRTKNTF